MSDCPTREVIDREVEQARNLIDFNSPQWKQVEDYLRWYRMQVAISSLALDDPLLRAKTLGKAALMNEFINMAEDMRRVPVKSETEQ